MGLVSTNKIDATKYELIINVDGEGFEKALQEAYLKARKNININGFRKGKAPRKMIEQLYGENVFFEDAVNLLVNTDIAPVVEETDYELIASPDIEVTSVNKNDGVSFKVTITTKPEVEISDYKGIEVEKVVKTVTDEDVNNQLEMLRERNGRLVTIEDRAAENGDVAVIDFEGFKDGVAFEGGKDTNYELALGSNTFIPGFEEQIVGKKTGEEFTINVTFPENYQMEEIAGQPCEFKIKLNEIKAKELPELDDEFARDVSDFDTFAEYEADTKAKIADRKAKAADAEVTDKIVDAAVAKMDADIPEAMYVAETENFVRDYDTRLRMQGLDLKTYFKYTGLDLDALRTQMRPQAEKQVKTRLTLEKIAELEGITATEEEIEAEYARLAEAYGMEADKVKEAIEADALAEDIKVKKAVDFLKENAVITEVAPEAKAPAKKKTTTRKKTAKKADAEEAAPAEEAPAADAE